MKYILMIVLLFYSAFSYGSEWPSQNDLSLEQSSEMLVLDSQKNIQDSTVEICSQREGSHFLALERVGDVGETASVPIASRNESLATLHNDKSYVNIERKPFKTVPLELARSRLV